MSTRVVQKPIMLHPAQIRMKVWGWSAVEVGYYFQAMFATWDVLHPPVEVSARVPISKSTREAVINRDGLLCSYCGTSKAVFEIDHVHPVARGGSNHIDNLCVACNTCNRAKRARLLSEWKQ